MMKRLNKNFRPSCIHDNKEPAYSSTGYILPCCWCDTGFLLQDEDLSTIVQSKFKLDNVDKISDITESKEWKDFFKFEKIPLVCQRYCGGGKSKEVKYHKLGSL